MIKVENLSYSFPQKDLYNKVSFTLEDGQHCAFIGTSGTGKSTLIHILMNPEDYLYDGKLEIDPNCRIGYVSQFPQFDADTEMTVFDYLAEEFVKLQSEITAICTEMETATDLEPLLERYQEVLDAFTGIDGDNYENNINKKLNLAELGKHASLPISKLSGGEFKLIQIIKEMLHYPNLLIMDEPDVFLDFEHINALRNLINSHDGTLLVITHNRYLLNHCFNKILHLENTELQEFNGRYIDYNFTLLQTKIELQELAIADTEEIERNKQLIDKLRAEATYYTCASRGRALHARVSFLERLEARRIKEPFVDIKQPNIQFSTDLALGEEEIILKVEDFQASFQDIILENVSFEIKATDKVAIIGANGTGKTTLLREIYKNSNPAIQVHDGVKMAFLSQLQGEMLTESNSILEELQETGLESLRECKKFIAQYGFEKENLHQKISALSGGEKNVLQLAKISTSNANLLLLDEPTSHLDIYSQLALETAIENYNGAILMVSHDFYTIANCMDYVLLIEDKTIRRMSIRKFRKMIYANHFSKDYIEVEAKKKTVEVKIAKALKDTNFTLAKNLCDELEGLNKRL